MILTRRRAILDCRDIRFGCSPRCNKLAQASRSDITWELVQEARMLREAATRRESTAGVGMTPCRLVTHGAGHRGNAGAGPTSEASPDRLDNFWAGVQRLRELGEARS